MNKTLMLTLTCILAAHAWGCIDPDHGTTDADDTTDPETDTVAPEEEEESSGVVERKVPEKDPGCTPDDEYNYLTTSYSSEETYLWRCSGFGVDNLYHVLDVFKKCKVKQVYANVGICSDGRLYNYYNLKSETTTNACWVVSKPIVGGFYNGPLYGGYCQ